MDATEHNRHSFCKLIDMEAPRTRAFCDILVKPLEIMHIDFCHIIVYLTRNLVYAYDKSKNSMMSKRTYFKRTNALLLLSALLFSGIFAGQASAGMGSESRKFFKINKPQERQTRIAGVYKSPFRGLRNYKATNRFPSSGKGFSHDRDYRRAVKQTHRSHDENEFVWPFSEDVQQRISSPFGYRIHPVTGRRAFHAGVDIAVARGTPVLATHEGVVEKVTTHKNLGRYVMVRHSDDEYSMYGHLSAWNVDEGDSVVPGDVVGKVGSTGRSTGPHLDYSIRRNGKPVNPMKHLVPPPTVNNLQLSSLQ